MKLKIAHLYPDLLNLYGDSGNVLCLEKRLEWRGIEYETDLIFAGSRCNLADYDIIFIRQIRVILFILQVFLIFTLSVKPSVLSVITFLKLKRKSG